METILGLIILAGGVRGAVILFGGHKNAPQRLRIAIGICLCLMILSIIGLSME